MPSVRGFSSVVQACSTNGALQNLALIMAMYREKEYSKSVQYWIEVVSKNILDAFPQLSAQLLALLVEVNLLVRSHCTCIGSRGRVCSFAFVRLRVRLLLSHWVIFATYLVHGCLFRYGFFDFAL